MRNSPQAEKQNQAEPAAESLKNSWPANVGFCTWLVLLALGMGWLAIYSRTSADEMAYPDSIVDARFRNSTSARSGTNAQLRRNETVLCFLHPKCPCSIATLRELQKILEEADCESILYFYTPAGFDTDTWLNTQLVNEAKRCPKFRIECDSDGKVADRFQVTTSGTILLYGTEGTLRFGGGITASRGHAGPSDAGEALRSSLLLPLSNAAFTFPAFGCKLKRS
ncbi:MAG: hypothetical protein AB8B50_04280 [Pirellulaceae bacterium]